jgi:hypothetical protein
VTDGVTTTGVTIFLPMWGSIDREMPLALCFMMRARGNAIGNRTAPNNPHSPKLWPLFFAIAPVTIPSRRQIQMMVTMIPSLPSGGGMASSEWWSVKERGTGSWVGRSDANLYPLTIHRHSVKHQPAHKGSASEVGAEVEYTVVEGAPVPGGRRRNHGPNLLR